jgi:hypothetical protein
MTESEKTLRKLGYNASDMARIFGYKNVKTFYNSPKKALCWEIGAEFVRGAARHLLNKD